MKPDNLQYARCQFRRTYCSMQYELTVSVQTDAVLDRQMRTNFPALSKDGVFFVFERFWNPDKERKDNYAEENFYLRVRNRRTSRQSL